MGLNLGQEAKAIFLFGDCAHALELLLHGYGAYHLRHLGSGLVDGGISSCVLRHPEKIFVREVGVVGK